VIVAPNFSLPGNLEILVIGDAANRNPPPPPAGRSWRSRRRRAAARAGPALSDHSAILGAARQFELPALPCPAAASIRARTAEDNESERT